jgi:hypothetical protein
VLFQDGEENFSSPTKKHKAEGVDTYLVVKPPPAPIKQRKLPKGPIEGLPVLSDDSSPVILKKLGKGSFGSVFEVSLHDHSGELKSCAMKVVKMKNGRISPRDLLEEASNFGSPKCIPGIGMSSRDGSKYFGFSPIADPLDKASITSDNVEQLVSMTHDALMGVSFSLIPDANPENLGIIHAGTPIPVLGDDGMLKAGSLVEEDEVVVIDIGNIANPNDCNGKYGALFDEDAMLNIENQKRYRSFKCDMMSALLRNRILVEPRNEYDIVREICEIYRYTYAAGDRR